MQKIAKTILLTVLAALFLGGCQSNMTGYSRSFFGMDTIINISFYSADQEAAASALKDAEEEFMRVDRLTSRYPALGQTAIIPGSVQDINAQAGQWVQLDEELFALLSLSLEWAQKTEGAFDISLGAVSDLWDFANGGHIPEPQELEEALSGSGYAKITLDKAGLRILIPQGMVLDLGAVAKGYAVDCVAQKLKNIGIDNGIIDAGGNIFTLNKQYTGELYTIGIRHPDLPGEIWQTVKTNDQAVVTSGNYQRFFMGPDGQVYHHILDPETGYPSQASISVTVVHKSSTLADILSTALFVMGHEKGQAFSETLPDTKVLYYTD